MLCVFTAAVLARRCDRSVTVYRWNPCMECSVNVFYRCPSFYTTVSIGEGEQRCSYLVNFGASFGLIAVPGCQHLCARTVFQRECCPGFWGQDCQACPGSPPCSGRGSCGDRINGNGQCTCQDGFNGFACELCKDSNKFGSYCNETCSCLHGDCDSGLHGTGHCKPDSCHLGYIGQDCSITLPDCIGNLTCGANANCFQINNTDTCVCNPGYKNVSNTCTAINHCLENTHGCHNNSDCFYLGPGKHNCTCAAGYTGDGTICVEIDPCQWQNGGCPTNSTACNYLQPGKSNCSCLPGFQNFTSGVGCTMIDLCENGGGCDVNANCTMEGPGSKRCDCKEGYRGNGSVCFGNILQRVTELNVGGPDIVRGKLTTAIDLFTGSFVHQALSGSGPFTLFLMVDSAFANLTQEQKGELTANLDMASHFVSRHLVAGDLGSISLKEFGEVSTLQGINARVTENQNVTHFKLDGHFVTAKVLLPDLLAGNGMIHVIDKIMWHVGDYKETSSTPSLQVLFVDSGFSIFASLLQSSGIAAELNALGAQYTLFVPVNSAFDKIDNSTMRFLVETDEGRRKMKSLLRNHILTGKFSVLDLIYSGRVRTVEGESVLIKLTSTGGIFLDEDARVINSNILTSDGVLHISDNLLIPDDIQPLLPRFCNRKISSRGICYRCSAVQAMPRMGCPIGYSPSNTTNRCLYRLYYGSVFIGRFVGCTATTCSAEVPECCSGFYGRPCHPCPGPFGNACYGNGKCLDKVAGNGSCICEANYKGTACELCQQDDKFGPLCNQTCTCMYGKCDNGPMGNGTCVPHSCLTGFHGNNCDQRDVPCLDPSSSLRCHVFASCVRQGIVDSCQCNAGYEGSGTQCTEIDPCSKPNRGGCHHEAVCIKTGPGTNNCTCGVGFRGDGFSCVPIDPCQEMGRGYCHSNADCQYVSPGQSTCVCKAGYTGDGASCSEINPCLVNNGGCSSDAQCVRTGPGNHTCQCSSGYIVNGNFCLVSVATIIGRMNPNLENYIRQANVLHYLSDPSRNLTLFAPSRLAISQMPLADSQYWTNSTNRLQYLIRYHILDQQYSLQELRSKSSVNASNGLVLNITKQGQTVIIDASAQIVQANITAENGFVHIIDKVLLPPRLSFEAKYLSTSELLNTTAEFSDFYSILKRLRLLPLLDACESCTVFAPTNAALKIHVLLQNNSVTANILKYHVVRRYLTEESIRSGEEYVTLLGHNYPVKLTKLSGGMLQVNGIRVVTNGHKARRAILFGLNGVLQPVKRNCDLTRRIRFAWSCRLCPFQIPTCPSGSTRIGIQINSCWFITGIVLGCRAICERTTTVKRCCSGFWGPDCQSCPGYLSSPCSSNGQCGDGISGDGHCKCSANFTGTACERCIPGKYGANCMNECMCGNGLCNDGVHGDGTCLCHHGWKGPLCDSSANYTYCLPTKCSQNATCWGSIGKGRCECDAGFTGNGTHCTGINTCLVNNGGCHQNANCSVDLRKPSLRSCKCQDDFQGDGEICIAIDPCQTNNGGCHFNATCVNIGPNKRNCFCKEGFSGDGVKSCLAVDPCEVDNGGCSARADCTQTGPHQRNCVCRGNYVGDGFTCIGDITEALQLDPQLSEMNRLITKYGLDKLLGSHGHFNLLAPVNDALLKSTSRKRRSVIPAPSTEEMLLKYHIISCVRFLSFSGDSVNLNLTTLLGPRITVEKKDNVTSFSDSFGNVSRLVGAYEASNGILIKLDSVLTPPPSGEGSTMDSYVDVARSLGYKEFVNLVERAGLRNTLDVQVNKPLLMFWPTDDAIRALPNNISHLSELIQFVQYHVVVNIQSDFSTQSFLRSGAGLELRTLGRSSLFVSCKGGRGDIFVNGESKLIARDVAFDGGIAFGVDKALIPLHFGGNCDEIKESHVMGQCGNCFLPVSCPQDTSLINTTNHNCTYNGDLLGCQPICLQRTKVKRCCENYYGPSCLACPGGIKSPCGGRGHCSHGLEGSGECECNPGFAGTACERCRNDTFVCPAPSMSCDSNNDGCHVFAVCSQTAVDQVNCSCKPGYHGDGYYCEMIDECLTNNGGCSANSKCLFTGPGTRRCRCKVGFYQVGSTCQPHQPNSPCAQNHGGCSLHADCVDNGNGVTCSCRAGFIGDGITCEGTIIEVLLETNKSKEFFKVLYGMSLKSKEASFIYEELQKPTTNLTVFVPINSAVVAKKFTMHVLKSHIVPGRLPLNNLNGVLSVTTLAGTKLLIRKIPNGEVLINGVAHVVVDIPAVNGLVHVIDQMIPLSGPPPPSTATPTEKRTDEPTRKQSTEPVPASASTPKKQSTEPVPPSASTPKPGVINARTQDNDSVGRGAIAGIIIAIILVVLLLGFLLYKLKKRNAPSGAKYTKNVETVEFHNEAYGGTGVISFDNVLYDNLDPVLMPALDFPIDDKQSLPQDRAMERGGFGNPIYSEGIDSDSQKQIMDQFSGTTNQGQAQDHLDFENPGYGLQEGGTLDRHGSIKVSNEEGVKEFANPMFKDTTGATVVGRKLNLDSNYLPGGEDTC